MPPRSKTSSANIINYPGAYVLNSALQRSPKIWTQSTAGPYSPIQRYSGLTSSLSYETGNDGSFRPCTHVKTTWTAAPIESRTLTWDYTRTPSSFNSWTTSSGFQKAFHQDYYNEFLSWCSSDTLPDLNSINWGSLSQTALESMLPSLGGQNSYLNYLLELRDFRKLASSLSGQIADKMTVLEALLGFNRKDGTLAKLSKSYLMGKFGYQSLYNDVKSFFDAAVNFKKRIDTFVKLANTDLQAHFGTTISGTARGEILRFNSGAIGGKGVSGSIGGQARITALASNGVKYNATLRYRYPLPPELSRAGSELKQLLDVLGVSLNPAIVWNAIPFTFLVDYFVNIGKWLNRLRIDNIRFQTEIRDFCHSAKVTRATVYDVQFRDGFAGPNNEQMFFWGPRTVSDMCEKTSYVRKKGIPNFLTAFQVTGLNQAEFAIGGALIGARSRRHPIFR